MRTHGGLPERSLRAPIGKGREGKGREVGHPTCIRNRRQPTPTRQPHTTMHDSLRSLVGGGWR